jgi:hypothetical protein
MHNTPNKSSNSSKTLHKTHYTKSKQPKGQPIGLDTHKNGKFPQRVIQTMYSDVVWFLGMSSHS